MKKFDFWVNTPIAKPSIKEIEKKLQMFFDKLRITDRSNEIQIRQTELEKVTNLNCCDASKIGATKYLTATIQNYRQEEKLFHNSNDEMMKLAENIHNLLLDEEKGSTKEAKIILSIFLEGSPSIEMFSLSVEIMEHILVFLRFTRQHNQKRFSENLRDGKEQNIKHIKKALEIASRYNNHHLINECHNMIELIEKEDLITEKILFRNLFWQIYSSLRDTLKVDGEEHLLHNGHVPLKADSKLIEKEKSATMTARHLVELIANEPIDFTPKDEPQKKEFYENGYNEPRILYYF
ncbi:MAG: hypothetical protein PHN18_12625 [Sulfurospirillaceae bacterium]|nr:hypothetical protein [Sulfurospirillaceae bacterium]MDD2827708.1 hypothetical protein [Sulfurospirillaceae bacterium]